MERGDLSYEKSRKIITKKVNQHNKEVTGKVSQHSKNLTDSSGAFISDKPEQKNEQSTASILNAISDLKKRMEDLERNQNKFHEKINQELDTLQKEKTYKSSMSHKLRECEISLKEQYILQETSQELEKQCKELKSKIKDLVDGNLMKELKKLDLQNETIQEVQKNLQQLCEKVKLSYQERKDLRKTEKLRKVKKHSSEQVEKIKALFSDRILKNMSAEMLKEAYLSIDLLRIFMFIHTHDNDYDKYLRYYLKGYNFSRLMLQLIEKDAVTMQAESRSIKAALSGKVNITEGPYNPETTEKFVSGNALETFDSRDVNIITKMIKNSGIEKNSKGDLGSDLDNSLRINYYDKVIDDLDFGGCIVPPIPYSELSETTDINKLICDLKKIIPKLCEKYEKSSDRISLNILKPLMNCNATDKCVFSAESKMCLYELLHKHLEMVMDINGYDTKPIIELINKNCTTASIIKQPSTALEECSCEGACACELYK